MIKKVRKTIILDPKVDEDLKRMAKVLGVNQSQLVNDLVKEASTSFFKLFDKAKITGLYSSSLKVISEQLDTLAKEFENNKGFENEKIKE
jgi:exosome complex RNA-binding protein Rrp42 (RNase PH superfamily)